MYFNIISDRKVPLSQYKGKTMVKNALERHFAYLSTIGEIAKLQ